MGERPDISTTTTIPLEDTPDHRHIVSAFEKIRAVDRCLWKDLRIGGAVLFVSWGCWTLADRALVDFSPWSEIGAVAIGAALYLWEFTEVCLGRCRDRIESHAVFHLGRV
jgi:hypothetical protein